MQPVVLIFKYGNQVSAVSKIQQQQSFFQDHLFNCLGRNTDSREQTYSASIQGEYHA